MDLQRVHSILNNEEKCDVFFNERPVWIQGIDEGHNMAKVGFVDNFEEQHTGGKISRHPSAGAPG